VARVGRSLLILAFVIAACGFALAMATVEIVNGVADAGSVFSVNFSGAGALAFVSELQAAGGGSTARDPAVIDHALETSGEAPVATLPDGTTARHRSRSAWARNGWRVQLGTACVLIPAAPEIADVRSGPCRA
jgi:hypothetical protein